MNANGKKAVVLLSGGLDSATALAAAIGEGYECITLAFDYGQRHRIELEAARRVSRALGASRHMVMAIDLRALGGSALTADIDVPKSRDPESMAAGIPVTYVPARNIVFLSLALAAAETRGAEEIFIGVNALDYSGYPDCRPSFIEAYEKMAAAGTKAGTEGRPVKIRAPLIHMTKAEIISLGAELGVPFEITHSCYDPAPDGRACGLCDSCLLRKKGFHEAGLPDPTPYQA